jgi:hypothetical protein
LEPKFITFLQCTFDKNWEAVPSNYLTPEQQFILIRMSPFKSKIDSSKIQLLDMSYKEVKLVFKLGSIVGVSSGMLYCNSEDVTDTSITDAPMRL